MPDPIDAMPTKELFIDMLTRDIGLIPSIIDLADNSADSAKKSRGDGSLEGLAVRLNITPEKFRIEDNCGGMSVDTARRYAFRFGRPRGAPSVKHSVGQFGVGMKRAIFKMGRAFRVESSTVNSRFVVDVDVNVWAGLDEWQFDFSELEEGPVRSAVETGTVVTVTALNADVAEMFGLATVENKLRDELQARLQDPISKGFAVTLNGIPVVSSPLMILASDQIAPAYKEIAYGTDGKKVAVRLFCGLGRSRIKNEERAQAGWHVYCNGRLILEADKSAVTGWGEDMDGFSVPGFHGQYNYMRGFAYFDSEDPARLPWNTTKTGLNTDSPIYRATKLHMMAMMRPVIDFLNKLKEEKTAKDDGDEKGPLESVLDDSKPTPVASVRTQPVFIPPTPLVTTKTSGPPMQRIQYDVPLKEMLAVKKELGASTLKEVGGKDVQVLLQRRGGRVSESSFEKFNYALRPAKNIERKMFCEAFGRLPRIAPLSSYQYVGFGAIGFHDFSLFHQRLGIHRMLSIEGNEGAKDRITNNIPYSCIQMRWGLSHEVLPTLSWGERCILWLDYERPLDTRHLSDIALVCNALVSGWCPDWIDRPQVGY